MIFVYNLPRSFGQSIQEMLSILYHTVESGVDVWHSLFRYEWLNLKPTDIGVVECTAPVSWCEANYPEAQYIMAIRADEGAWLTSCADMYDLAQEERWTNPIWQLDLDHFSYYAREWCSNVYRWLPEGRTMVWNIQECGPEWESLCSFLNMPTPSVPVPWVDWIGRQTGPHGYDRGLGDLTVGGLL